MKVTQKYYNKKLKEEIKWIIQQINCCATRGIDEINIKEVEGWAESNLASRRIFVIAVIDGKESGK